MSVARWAIAGAPVLWLATATALLVASLFGYSALAATDLTLPEAAAIRDEAEVLRLIRAGTDPNARGLVRRGFLSEPDFVLTPLEAATAARHTQVVTLLVANGAELNERNLPVLYCLAQANGASDIGLFLRQRMPADQTLQCADVRLPI